jgi:MoaA/NifB/PqqE/SkfB family radical SAM enzyme
VLALLGRESAKQRISGIAPKTFPVGDFLGGESKRLARKEPATMVKTASKPRPGQSLQESRYQDRWAGERHNANCVARGDYFGIRPTCCELIPVMRCPLKHPWCSQRKIREKTGTWDWHPGPCSGDMPIGKAVTYLRKLREGKLRGVCLTGGGDPFAHGSMRPMIAMARAFGLRVAAINNGTFAGDLEPEDIVELGLDWCRFSLNTLDLHSEWGGYDPLQRDWLAVVLENLRRVSEARQADSSSKTQLVLCTVYTERNVEELPEIARVAAENRFDAWFARPAIDYFPQSNHDQVPLGVLTRAQDLIEGEIRPQLRAAGCAVYNPSHRRVATGDAQRRHTRCYGTFCPKILHNGLVSNCTEPMYDDPEYIIGDLNRESMAEILTGERRRELHRRVARDRCSRCPVTCRQTRTNNFFAELEALRAQPGGQAEVARRVSEIHAQQVACGASPWVEM